MWNSVLEGTATRSSSLPRGVAWLQIRPRATALVLGAITLVLAGASLAGQVARLQLGHTHLLGLVPLLNVDLEHNLPTWFSSYLLLAGGLLLAFIWRLEARGGNPYARHWGVLAAFLLAASIDEFVSLHERLIEPFQELLGLGGIFYYGWFLPVLPLLVLLGAAYRRFFLHLAPSDRLRFSVAGTLYVSGAIGMELVGGRHAELYSTQNFAYAVITTVEETLEMAGAIALLYALLHHAAARFGTVNVRVRPATRSSASPGA